MDLRNEIAEIIGGDDALTRADLALNAVAIWLESESPDRGFRAMLALDAAAPGRFEFGVFGDAELEDATSAVAAALAEMIRPEVVHVVVPDAR